MRALSSLPPFRAVLHWLLLVLLAWLGLQVFFFTRIAVMAVVAPASTAFERSEAWRIVTAQGRLRWRQDWVSYERVAEPLKRAVIVSEDDLFAQHDGVQWEAMEKAWLKNTKAEQAAQRRAAQLAKRANANNPRAGTSAKVVGGSTITQQLAKNLFLSGERTLLRKGQELILTVMLEATLSKQRILTLYLNHVEWGEGIFGAQAAAQHYFGKPAAQLNAWEASRLAVMLPAPKRYQKLPQSDYLASRTEVIAGRLHHAQLPAREGQR